MLNLYHKSIETPLGSMDALADIQGIHYLGFKKEKNTFPLLKKFSGYNVLEKTNSILDKLETELDLYFSKKLKVFTLPITLSGTHFQKLVWQALSQVPYGKTVSYEDEALMIGNPKSFRAVANTNGLNPVSILIPCHRVIRKNKSLGGYASGIERKKALLKIEGINL